MGMGRYRVVQILKENVILETLWAFIFRSQACVFNDWIRLNHISLMTTSTATEYNERRSSESSTSSCCEAQLPADRPPSTINVQGEPSTCPPPSEHHQRSLQGAENSLLAGRPPCVFNLLLLNIKILVNYKCRIQDNFNIRTLTVSSTFSMLGFPVKKNFCFYKML